jgi:hypothetical protein
MRAWLASSEMDSVRHHLGVPPDLYKFTCTFDKRVIGDKTYLGVGLEKNDGTYSFRGHQIALWPEGAAAGEAK